MRSSRRRRTQRKTRNKPTVFEINITRPRLCVPVKGQHPTARYSTERAMNNIVFFKVSISTLCHLPTRALYPCDHMPYQENTKSGWIPRCLVIQSYVHYWNPEQQKIKWYIISPPSQPLHFVTMHSRPSPGTQDRIRTPTCCAPRARRKRRGFSPEAAARHLHQPSPIKISSFCSLIFPTGAWVFPSRAKAKSNSAFHRVVRLFCGGCCQTKDKVSEDFDQT